MCAAKRLVVAHGAGAFSKERAASLATTSTLAVAGAHSRAELIPRRRLRQPAIEEIKLATGDRVAMRDDTHDVGMV